MLKPAAALRQCLPRQTLQTTSAALSTAIRAVLLSLPMAALPLWVPGVQAETTQPAARSYNIPAGPLSGALSRFAGEAGVLLSADARLTQDKTSRGLQGSYTVQAGFAALLAGSGLMAAASDEGSFTLVQAPRSTGSPATSNSASSAITLPTVTVTEQAETNFDTDIGFKAEYQTTATKTPQSIRETPQSISVVTRDNLEARQVFDLGTALQTSAGVSVVSGTGPFGGRDSQANVGGIQIRGIDVGGRTLKEREDGFRSPLFGTDPDLAPYERIEVLKGPASTLYGRGSAGGFINRVRKKPLREFQAELAPTIGSFDFYRLDGDVTSPLFKSEKVRGRLVAAYEDSGYFVDQVESERVVVAPSLDLDLSGTTRLLLQGTYQHDEFVPNVGFPLALSADGREFRAPDVRRSRNFGLPNGEKHDAEIRAVTGQLEQELGDNWLATLKCNRTDTEFVPGGAGLYAYGFYGDGDTNLLESDNLLTNDVFSGELQLNGKINLLGRPATVTLGVDHADLDVSMTYRLDYAAYANPDYNPSAART